MRTLISIVAVSALLAAPAAFACDQHAAAAGAARQEAHAKGNGCPGKTADGIPACCRKKMEATTAALSADGPTLAATGVARAVVTEGHRDCPFAALRDAAAHGCKASAAEVQAAPEFHSKGKVLCARCDLKKSETCASVFKGAAADAEPIRLCGDGLSEQLEKITKHGEVTVNVHGHRVGEGKDSVLCLDGFSVGTI